MIVGIANVIHRQKYNKQMVYNLRKLNICILIWGNSLYVIYGEDEFLIK